MNDATRRRIAQTLRHAAVVLAGTPYDPENPEHRKEFADKLKQRLESAGFKLAEKRSRGEEDSYTFTHRKDPGLTIKVNTSAAGGSMRELAADAIRVRMLYQQRRHGDKKEIPIVPPTPPQMKKLGRDPKLGYTPIIKRMPGTPIDKLVERVVQRARDAYTIVNELERCEKCTAPMAFKKIDEKKQPLRPGDAIKRYCAEICWEAKKATSGSAEDPIEFNTKLAKLLGKLKRDIGATKVRQGYKGTGSKKHRRQVWISHPDIPRGIDVWLEDGKVDMGGVIYTGVGSIPHKGAPEEVYAEIVKWFNAFIGYLKKKATSGSSNAVKEQVDKADKLDQVDPTVAKLISKSGLDDGDRDDDVIKVSKKSWPASSLKPSQTTMQLPMAVRLALLMLKNNSIGGDLGALVSKDKHILDGHHRWAATILASGTKGKVGGWGASVDGKELLRVLNIISKGVFNVRNGNPGTGNIKDFSPSDVREVLEDFVANGISGKWPWSSEEVRAVLEDNFGSIEDGISTISDNVKKLTTKVPAWAPDRKQMPVIEPEQAPDAADVLNEGLVDWNEPHVSGSTLSARAMPVPRGTTEEQQNAALDALADGLMKYRNVNAAVSYVVKVLTKKWPTLVRGATAGALAEWARGQARL